jgi:hypothetical protein
MKLQLTMVCFQCRNLQESLLGQLGLLLGIDLGVPPWLRRGKDLPAYEAPTHGVAAAIA